MLSSKTTTVRTTQDPITILISFASRTKFKICFVIESEESSSMSFDICLPKKGITNVYSSHGTGKSTFFSKKGHVQFDHEILKTKEKTIDFLERMKYSLLPLVLDDYELVQSLSGVKEFKSGMMRGSFYVISTCRIDEDWIDQWYEFPGVCPLEFARSFNNVTESDVLESLVKNKGNMTRVKLDLETFSSHRDIFMSSKEYIVNLLKDPNPTHNIHKYLSEHGNTFGIIQENYTSVRDSSIHEIASIAHDFSDADIIDVKMYTDVSWDLMPFFNLSACILPAYKLGPIKDPKVDRPARSWTKYSNACMKMNRFKKLRISREEISLWILRANVNDPLEKFDSYDIDSLNQLAFSNKIHPKITNKLKALRKVKK
jgi:hypothetical protein